VLDFKKTVLLNVRPQIKLNFEKIKSFKSFNGF